MTETSPALEKALARALGDGVEKSAAASEVADALEVHLSPIVEAIAALGDRLEAIEDSEFK